MHSRLVLSRGLLIVAAISLTVIPLACGGGGSDDSPQIDPLVITTTSLPEGFIGVPYSLTLTATGGAQPYSWSVVSGALPAGITLAANGDLTGTPTVSGLFTFTAQVEDPRTPPAIDTATFDLDIRATLAIQTTSLPNAFVGTPYAFTLVANGGLLPLNWTHTGGTLPVGISFGVGGDLSGTPTTPGWASLTFQVSDSQVPPATDTATLDLFVFTPSGQNNLPVASVCVLTGTQRGLVDLCYTLLDDDSDPVVVTVEYSTDGGGTYAPATSGPTGEGFGPFTTSPAPIDKLFTWDSMADVGAVAAPATRLLVTPMDIDVGLPSETADFALDNTPGQGVFVEVPDRLQVERMDHTVTLLNDGRVLIAGGLGTSNVVLGTAETFSPVTGLFTLLPSLLTTPRTGHTATLLADGTVLITGGIPSTLAVELDTAEIFDPTTDTFLATGSMSEARIGHAAVATPTGAFITGGSNTPGPTYLDEAEEYDLTAGTFSVVAGNFFRQRADHTAHLLPNGRIFMTGGSDEWEISTEEFDPTTGTSPATESITPSAEVRWHAASEIPDGTILITGGSPGRGVTTIENAFGFGLLYTPSNPAGSRLGNVGPMVSTRRWHTATYIPTGHVLVTGGGTNALTITADAELYDVSSPGFTSTAPMTIPRLRHVALLLPDGRVLITGGTTDGFDPVAVAERYHP